MELDDALREKLLRDPNSVCRTCLEAVSSGTSLLASLSLVEQVLACTGVRLVFDDGLPPLLCNRCLTDLRAACGFRTRTRRADRLLQTLLVPKSEPDDGPDWPDPEDFLDRSEDQPVLDGKEEDAVECKREVEDPLGNGDTGQIENPPAPKKKYKCTVCEKPLSSKYSLDHHLKTVHGDKRKNRVGSVSGWGVDRRFHCTECTYSTRHSQSLVYHVRVHTGEKPFKCEVCNKGFSQPGSLTCHKKTHSDETFYACELCGKQFKYKETYEAHKNVHTEARNFICEICKKGLKSKKSLENHMNRHYNIRNYSCETCGATFVTGVELQNHSKKHAVDKKFACNLCGFKTYMKKGLETHLRRHTGDRPFKCDLCDLSCYTKGELKCHKRKHTREKNYSCPVCELKFIHSSSVNKHMLKVHGIKYSRANLVDRRVVK